MRALVVIAVLLGVAYAAPKRLAPVEPSTGQVVQDEYIVVFNERATDELVERHHHKLSAIMAQYNDSQRAMRQYHIGSFRGYSAHFNDKTLETVREEMIVKYIEHNQVVSAYQGECLAQRNAPWGLARTSQESAVNDGTYTYSESAMGEGVDVYIIDTGIMINHNDFGSRAKWGANFADSNDNDGNGHGTHVAGTVMGDKYGLAKKATAIAVKVLNDGGSGTTAGVISGIQWAANQHTSSGRKSVANMSLGGGRSDALNGAVEAAAEDGLAFSLAAGNNGGDACRNSPASAEVMAVAASDSTDTVAYFSDTGECVEIIAPGVGVESAYIPRTDSTSSLSGTSMAAPHVAGVMAKILSDTENRLDPKDLEDRVKELALEGKISGLPSTQVNLLLHHTCG